jgi:hypothetical protein
VRRKIIQSTGNIYTVHRKNTHCVYRKNIERTEKNCTEKDIQCTGKIHTVYSKNTQMYSKNTLNVHKITHDAKERTNSVQD